MFKGKRRYIFGQMYRRFYLLYISYGELFRMITFEILVEQLDFAHVLLKVTARSDFLADGVHPKHAGMDEITNAVKRYWKHGLFSNVSITIEKVVGTQAYLNIALTQRPRLSKVNYYGVKKSEQDDLNYIQQKICITLS